VTLGQGEDGDITKELRPNRLRDIREGRVRSFRVAFLRKWRYRNRKLQKTKHYSIEDHGIIETENSVGEFHYKEMWT
jgi:hypothetical protein